MFGRKLPRLDDFSEWNQMTARLVELQQKRALADGRVGELGAALSAAAAPVAASDRLERARAMVVGETVDFQPRQVSSRIQADLEAAREERAVLDEAIEMQKRELERLRVKLSENICRKLLADHHKMAYRIAKLAKELAEASAEEDDFRKALEDGGIQYSSVLRPKLFTGIGRLEDHHSRISYYLREAADFGYPVP
jgi:chromosome segregation ATPase